VKDVEVAFEILHAEHGMEAFGEDGAAAVGVEAQDASLGSVGRGADVHRVLGDEDTAVGSDGDNGGVLDVRSLGDESEGPTRDWYGRRRLLREDVAGEEDQEGKEDLSERGGWGWMKPQSWIPPFLKRAYIRRIRMRAG
jgi:hypothetical protein